MGRFRSFLRRVAKPAAMVGVSGLLAVSLTVTTTQKAEAAPIAVAPVILAAEAIVGGASLPLAMPSVLATSMALHPVGWVIAGGVAVAGLALGAYYTRDYWLPYLTGDFGKPTASDAPTGAGVQHAKIAQYVRLDALVVTGNSFTVKIKYNPPAGTGGSQAYYVPQTIRCKDAAGVSVNSTYVNQNALVAGGSHTLSWACGTGKTLTAVAVYGQCTFTVPGTAACTTPSTTWAPENIATWGEWASGTPGFDPRSGDVKYKTTVECIDDAGTKSTITADWSGNEGGAKFPTCAGAGKGHGTGVYKIEGYAPTAPGAPAAPAETLWETTAPAVDPNYDKCGLERPGSGCRMAITLDGKPCVVGNFVCENWTEFKNDTDWGPRLGCTYGPYTLTLEQCSIMEPAYKPGGAPATEANADGNPATRNYTEPGGQTFTPTTTAPATVPGGAGSPQPGSDQAMYDCWPQGWGIFNPADWIAKPLRCAFEPKKDLTAVTTALAVKAEGKAPIGFLALDMGGPGGGGCPNWNISIPGMASQNVVCGSSFTDAIVAVRGPLFGLVATAMVWPLLRSMWYAAIPILRVTPSSGGK